MPVSPVPVQHKVVQRDLWTRTAQVAGRLNRAHGELVDIAAELIDGGHWGEGGFRSPEHYFVVRAGLSPARARDVVAIARRRAELPRASEALQAGSLSLDQAAVVAHHAPATHQASAADFARHATVPQLRRALSRHALGTDLAPDPCDAGEAGGAVGHDVPAGDTTAEGAEEEGVAGGPAPAQTAAAAAAAAKVPTPAQRAAERRACARPELSMHYDVDGRFQLRYSAPAPVGALVEQAIKEAKDALFTDAAAGPQPGGAGASYADALEEIAQRSLSSVGSTGRASHYRVYLHLSTGGAWVNGGGAIPRRLLDRFVTDGVVQPIWETEGRPVSVGRAMRILPRRTRRLIEDRDRGCRFPGCAATRFVEVHHLHEWAQGGRTDVDNQVSLCPFHHDAIDRGDFRISGDPTRLDGLVVTNRHGLLVEPPTAAELAAPPGGDPPAPPGTTAYRPPTGERARWGDVEILPDHPAPPAARLHLVTASPPSTAAPPGDGGEDDDLRRAWLRADEELVPAMYREWGS